LGGKLRNVTRVLIYLINNVINGEWQMPKNATIYPLHPMECHRQGFPSQTAHDGRIEKAKFENYEK